MNWLSKRDDWYLYNLLSVLESYGHENLTFREFISNLDVALDIWDSEPEDWSNQLLLKWAALLNKHGDPYFQEAATLSIEERSTLVSAIAELKTLALYTYEQRYINLMLLYLKKLEESQSDPNELVRNLSQELSALEGLTATDDYYGMCSTIDDLERLYSTFSGKNRKRLNEEQRKYKAECINDLKAAISRLTLP